MISWFVGRCSTTEPHGSDVSVGPPLRPSSPSTTEGAPPAGTPGLKPSWRRVTWDDSDLSRTFRILGCGVSGMGTQHRTHGQPASQGGPLHPGLSLHPGHPAHGRPGAGQRHPPAPLPGRPRPPGSPRPVLAARPPLLPGVSTSWPASDGGTAPAHLAPDAHSHLQPQGGRTASGHSPLGGGPGRLWTPRPGPGRTIPPPCLHAWHHTWSAGRTAWPGRDPRKVRYPPTCGGRALGLPAPGDPGVGAGSGLSHGCMESLSPERAGQANWGLGPATCMSSGTLRRDPACQCPGPTSPPGASRVALDPTNGTWNPSCCSMGGGGPGVWTLRPGTLRTPGRAGRSEPPPRSVCASRGLRLTWAPTAPHLHRGVPQP